MIVNIKRRNGARQGRDKNPTAVCLSFATRILRREKLRQFSRRIGKAIHKFRCATCFRSKWHFTARRQYTCIRVYVRNMKDQFHSRKQWKIKKLQYLWVYATISYILIIKRQEITDLFVIPLFTLCKRRMVPCIPCADVHIFLRNMHRDDIV